VNQPLSLATWLDTNMAGWRSYSSSRLHAELQACWRQRKFRKLRSHTRNDRAEAVLVGNTHYSYIEF